MGLLPNGKIWLILCCYDQSPCQNLEPGIAPRIKEYAEAGFSSMVNFYFPKHGDLDGIVYIWQAYSDSIATHPGWHPFNYLNNSYHRDADMDNMIGCATTLLLVPGVAQIFYGDETGRKLSDTRLNVDSNQVFRSEMDWNDIDTVLLMHFRRIGNIRKAHPVISIGKQIVIDTHTCICQSGEDTLLIRLVSVENQPININGYFSEGDRLVELYTGQSAHVKNGTVTFPYYQNKIAVISRK